MKKTLEILEKIWLLPFTKSTSKPTKKKKLWKKVCTSRKSEKKFLKFKVNSPTNKFSALTAKRNKKDNKLINKEESKCSQNSRNSLKKSPKWIPCLSYKASGSHNNCKKATMTHWWKSKVSPNRKNIPHSKAQPSPKDSRETTVSNLPICNRL